MKKVLCLLMSFAFVSCGELDSTVNRTSGGTPYNLELKRPGDKEEMKRLGQQPASNTSVFAARVRLYFLKDVSAVNARDLNYMHNLSVSGNYQATHALINYYFAINNDQKALFYSYVASGKTPPVASTTRVQQSPTRTTTHAPAYGGEEQQRRQLDALIAEANRELGIHDDPIARGVREGMRTAVPMVRDAAAAARRRQGGSAGGTAGGVRPTTTWSNDASGINRY